MDMDLDVFDDLLPDEAVNNVKVSSKFQPKPKFRPAKKPPVSASSYKSQTQNIPDTVPSGSSETGIAKPSDESNNLAWEENGACNASTETSLGVASDIFIGLESFDDFHLEATTLEENAPHSESVAVNSNLSQPGTEDMNPLATSESIVSSCMGHGRTSNQESAPAEMEVLGSLHLDELTAECGQGSGRFDAGSDVRILEGTYEANKSVSCSPNAYEINDAGKGLSPTFHQDDVLDLSSLGFTDLLAGEDTGYEAVRASNASWNASEGFDSPQQQLTSAYHQDEVPGHSLRRKIQRNKLMDETDDGAFDKEFSGEPPSSSAMEEENSNVGNCQLENEETSKTIPFSRKRAVNKGTTTRKRKKPDEGVPPPSQKPKRFAHSTRRRRVKKALLEIPEGELDYQMIPLRDIILLAEHKERQMKKEEAADGASQERQSSRNHHESGRTLDEDENREEQGNTELHDTTLYFNYHTYMNKPRTIRWSKQDTELFYEAVQQFGTDLSLIQQLFPDLSRHQIKLKYKKEERQHPMRLQQALSSRSKDHSHYQKVIERLKQMAGEETQNGEEEIRTTEDGISSQAHHDEEENERINERDVPNEYVETGSPLKEDADEEEEEECYNYTSS